MKRARVWQLLAGGALLVIVAAACGEQDQATDVSDSADDSSVTVLAKAEGWRDSLDETGGAVFEVAPDSDRAEQLWDENVPDDAEQVDDPGEVGRHADLQEVNFDTQLVAVWSFGESGSCPEWVETVTRAEDGVTVETTRSDEQPCTDDFHPYRMVLAIDRDLLPEPDTLPVPLVDGPVGEVIAYPASLEEDTAPDHQQDMTPTAETDGDEVALAARCNDVELDIQLAPGDKKTGTDVGGFRDPSMDDTLRQEYASENEGTIAEQIIDWVEDENLDEFGGAWVDGGLGTIVATFTENVEAHAEFLRESVDEGIAVAEVDVTYDQLEQAMQRLVIEEFESGDTDIYMYSADVHLNRVSLGIQDPDAEREHELVERYGSDVLCLEVMPAPIEAADHVQLLAKVEGARDNLPVDENFFSLMEVAYDRSTAEQLWTDSVPADLETADDDPAAYGIHGDLDQLDFDSQVVVSWTSGESGSCPEWIVDIESADEVAVFTDAHEPMCTDDYRAYRAVLALDREALPTVDELPVPIADEFNDDFVVSYPAYE